MSDFELPSDIDHPASDELAALLEDSIARPVTKPPTCNFSDDLTALDDCAAELKRVKNAAQTVIQHRHWQTREVFRSEPAAPSSPLKMAPAPFLTSSPPPSPSPRKKRKFTDIELSKTHTDRGAKAQRSYYGIDIHSLLDEAKAENSIPKAARELPTPPAEPASKKSSLLWTEKYRARKFTDLIGDERTHRSVMHWLKRWDPIVFPGSHRPKAKRKGDGKDEEERPHRKIMLLTGPPGLGKTTLAHVCAKQAGYEVQEINASDERSGNVVKGRIRDMIGTENVRGIDAKTETGKVRKAGKPVCVVVDEVDGVVSGSGGGGEGGFIKALIDLVLLDQKNTTALGTMSQAPVRKKKGDKFRLLRPMILICNDVYHPSLRPLRQSAHAEIIHVRKAPVQTLVSRLQGIFDRENVPCEGDGVRRLCEAAWGVSNRKEDRTASGAGEGDMRGIMVVGEWVAGKLRAENSKTGSARLTRRWVEDNILSDLSHGGGAARGLGRGGPKEIVDRIFQEGAGFPQTATKLSIPGGAQTGAKGVAESAKRTANARLRELVDTHGDTDRILTDAFTAYPAQPFQDDTLLSKPAAAYEWLHFHDQLSTAVHTANEWELYPYLSTPVLGFHSLFGNSMRAAPALTNPSDTSTTASTPAPFTGASAPWHAHEATKSHTASLQTLHTALSPPLSRLYPSPSTPHLTTELLPALLSMLSPRVNPVVITNGSGKDSRPTASVRKSGEQALVARAVGAMRAAGVRFERVKVAVDDAGGAGGGYRATEWVYRMEPPLDEMGVFGSLGAGAGASGSEKTRFAVRQVLVQEFEKESRRLAEAGRVARGGGAIIAKGGEGEGEDGDGEGMETVKALGKLPAVKRDFFGRPVAMPVMKTGVEAKSEREGQEGGERVWVTFHEGFSNAVRKPLSLGEILGGL